MKVDVRASFLFTGLVAALALVGCGGSGGGGSVAAEPQAQVRVLNALNNGNAPASNLHGFIGEEDFFGGNIIYALLTYYLSVSGGHFSPRFHGDAFGDLGFDTDISLVGNRRYTVVAAGRRGSNDGFNPRLYLLREFPWDNGSVGSGQTAIRFVNFATQAPVGLVGSNGGSLGLGLSNIGYGYNEDVNTWAKLSTSQLAKLGIRKMGSGSNLTLNGGNFSDFRFMPGHAYTVYLVGQEEAGTQGLSAIVSDEERWQ